MSCIFLLIGQVVREIEKFPFVSVDQEQFSWPSCLNNRIRLRVWVGTYHVYTAASHSCTMHFIVVLNTGAMDQTSPHDLDLGILT